MMKSLFKTIFLIFAVSYWAMSASAQAAEGQPFTIKGNIKGIKNGTKVSLRCRESGKYIEAQCLSQGSSFVLKGQVVGTMLVELSIDDKPQAAYGENDYAESRGGKFLLEAADYTVSAACFDSIPRNYDLDAVPMVHEKNLKIVGARHSSSTKNGRMLPMRLGSTTNSWTSNFAMQSSALVEKTVPIP